MSIEGPSDTDSFGIYVREILAPNLKAGQIVVMDNLSVHKGKWVRELIERRGCQLWLLPPYSPDFNPIEVGLLQGEGAAQESAGEGFGGALRGHRRGAFGDKRAGRPWLLRALRVRYTAGAFDMKSALGEDDYGLPGGIGHLRVDAGSTV